MASQALWSARFGGSDLTAATVAASLPVLGIPDTADFASELTPKRCRLIAVEALGKPAAGDNVAIYASLNGVVSGQLVSLSNALPTQLWSVGPNDGLIIDANQTVGMNYITTTGGTYTARDIYAEAIFEMLDD